MAATGPRRGSLIRWAEFRPELRPAHRDRPCSSEAGLDLFLPPRAKPAGDVTRSLRRVAQLGNPQARSSSVVEPILSALPLAAARRRGTPILAPGGPPEAIARGLMLMPLRVHAARPGRVRMADSDLPARAASSTFSDGTGAGGVSSMP